MKRLLRLAARLYPRGWRARYGVEFDALLEDRAAGWGDVWDVVKGGVQMQISRPGMGGLMALSAVCGLAAAIGVAIVIPNQYVATGVLVSQDGDKAIAEACGKVLSRHSLQSLVAQHDLYAAQRIRLPLEEILVQMRKDIWLGSDTHGAMRVSFANAEPAKAEAVTRDLMARMAGESEGRISVMEARFLPATAYSPNRAVIAGMGLAGGAAAGAVIAWIRRRRAR